MLLTLNSHEWPQHNFSLQYQYNIKQTSDEKKEKYMLGDNKLIQYQILQSNITRTQLGELLMRSWELKG